MSGRQDPFPTNLMRHCMSGSGYVDPRDWLIDLHKQLKSGKAMAKHLGVSGDTIQLWCRNCLIHLPRFKTKVKHNYDTNLTPRQIAEKYKVTYETGRVYSTKKRNYYPRKERVDGDGAQRKDNQAPQDER